MVSAPLTVLPIQFARLAHGTWIRSEPHNLDRSDLATLTASCQDMWKTMASSHP